MPPTKVEIKENPLLWCKWNPNFKGTYPELIVFHGVIDPIVNNNNANELIKQYINIRNTDYVEDEHFEKFRNNEDVELTIYKNSLQQEVVHNIWVRGMENAIALDTGNCNTQGGKTGIFSYDKDFNST